MIANNYVVELEHPQLGTIREVGMPIRFSRTPAGPRHCAPELGQDTEAVLLECGFDWDEINALRDRGAI